MNSRIAFALVLALAAVSASSALAAERCIRFPAFPTLTCAHGFEPKEIKSHCWACVAHSAHADSAIAESDAEEVTSLDELAPESLDQGALQTAPEALRESQ